MASQIQGLKKVAAANRNKTKSQMRDTHPNQGPNLSNSAQVPNAGNALAGQHVVGSPFEISLTFYLYIGRNKAKCTDSTKPPRDNCSQQHPEHGAAE